MASKRAVTPDVSMPAELQAMDVGAGVEGGVDVVGEGRVQLIVHHPFPLWRGGLRAGLLKLRSCRRAGRLRGLGSEGCALGPRRPLGVDSAALGGGGSMRSVRGRMGW